MCAIVTNPYASTRLLLHEPAHLDRAVLASDVEHIQAAQTNLRTSHWAATSGLEGAPARIRTRSRRRQAQGVIRLVPGGHPGERLVAKFTRRAVGGVARPGQEGVGTRAPTTSGASGGELEHTTQLLAPSTRSPSGEYAEIEYAALPVNYHTLVITLYRNVFRGGMTIASGHRDQ
jgi:hypothetical protein